MSPASAPVQEFRHEAFLYEGEDAFVAGCSAFLREGLAAEEPTLVVVDAHKIERLRDALGQDSQAPTLHFADMAEVGANPARIIPAWQAFVERHGDRPRLRGIGEPIWPGRQGAELAECVRHETLLNLAFDGGRPWWLLCPYDTAALQPEVVDHARRTHPRVWELQASAPSGSYAGPLPADLLGEPLGEPTGEVAGLAFDATTLGSLRTLLARQAARLGMRSARIGDLLLAANEVATNSVRHGGGAGVARVWREGDTLLCEVRDAGALHDALAGRRAPSVNLEAPRGLWLANQLCDLVQLRSTPAGTVVRLHMHRG